MEYKIEIFGTKLLIDNFIMIKNKNRNNKYYWECEKRKHTKRHNSNNEYCNARAVTILVDGNHIVKDNSFLNHNHGPDPCRLLVKKNIKYIVSKALSSRDKPSQIIQEATSRIPVNSQPYMPSVEATRKIISRCRKHQKPPEPTSLSQIDIPLNLCKSFNGQTFLLKESTIESHKIYIFSTKDEISKLVNANYWVMDGTFKTVPSIFLQMYTIHAPVGGNNSRILPLVYVLMTSKQQCCYERLFEDLISICDGFGFDVSPKCIITDFEKAAINAAFKVFPECQQKGCFFHLGQNIWRKIQSSGLATKYGENEEFSLQLRCMWSLAFLHPSDIPNAFDQLKDSLPYDIQNYFEENYVHGKVRRKFRNGIVSRYEPLFPPSFWSIHFNHENNIPRTQNKVEAWHKRWKVLVGADHVGVYRIIEEMRKEQQHVVGKISSRIKIFY